MEILKIITSNEWMFFILGMFVIVTIISFMAMIQSNKVFPLMLSTLGLTYQVYYISKFWKHSPNTSNKSEAKK